MSNEEYSQEELDFIQPEITKEMLKLSIEDKQRILKQCQVDHKKNIKDVILKILKILESFPPENCYQILHELIFKIKLSKIKANG